MSYNTKELLTKAERAGFTHAGELNVKALVFMPEIRMMCNANSCQQYNKNWRCPPACGSIEEAAERAAQYSYGIIVQTVGKMEDQFDYPTMESTMVRHQKDFAALVDELKEAYDDILPMGAGTCNICKTCTYPDEPCRYPDKAISSMEAYGLWVSKVCELSNIPYNYGPLTVTYTSCFLLK